MSENSYLPALFSFGNYVHVTNSHFDFNPVEKKEYMIKFDSRHLDIAEQTQFNFPKEQETLTNVVNSKVSNPRIPNTDPKFNRQQIKSVQKKISEFTIKDEKSSKLKNEKNSIIIAAEKSKSGLNNLVSLCFLRSKTKNYAQGNGKSCMRGGFQAQNQNGNKRKNSKPNRWTKKEN